MKLTLIALGSAVAVAVISPTPASAQKSVERQKLVASNGTAGDEFGVQVAIDGTTMLIGAEQDDDSRGSAYVFDLQPDGFWAQTQQLFAGNPGPDDEFGCAVAIDGDWLAVGARLEDSGGSGAGSLYIFQRVAGVWSQTQRLQSNDVSGGDFFGIQVAIDGDRMAVAASRDDDNGTNSGSVYVFEQSGGTWSQVAKLKASDGEAVDQFGLALDLDGDRVIAASLFESAETGAVYVFERDTGGTWAETQKITASNGSAGDTFGISCDLDGDIILVGARTKDGDGSVYAYDYNGSTWVETDEFKASDGGNGDQFGFSVALDGDFAVVGAQRTDPDGISNAGQGYVFERRSNGTWGQNSIFLASDPEVADQLGWDCAISGRTFAFGAVWANPNGDNSGAVYVGRTSLLLSTNSVSVSSGGTVDYYIDLGPNRAGELYWLLGSFTGTDPGTILHTAEIPLNFDLYFKILLTKSNKPPFSQSRGTLDSTGSATCTLTVPGGLDSALIGLELFHAVTTYTAGPIRFVDSSFPVSFVFDS